MNAKAVLCVHQGTEKYGSDKSFVAGVAALERSSEFTIDIVLPGAGPIDDLIAKEGLPPARARHLWVLRKAGFVKSITVGLPKNLIAICRAMRDLFRYGIVYVNTAVIVDFFIASILLRKRMVVHVREIPVGFAMKVIRKLLLLSRARVIFNSEATRKAFELPATQPQTVVYNGFEAPKAYQKSLYDGSEKLRLLCIGRLNSWKGQEVLVRACALLPDALKERLSVHIVGGVYKDQIHFRDNLRAEIRDNKLEHVVSMIDFVDDPSNEYIAADIVVVPSTSPEPFGRVAIEGMAYGCGVIATDHGGLTEIVVDGETGALVAPGDADALAQSIEACLQSPALVCKWGDNGKQRFLDRFTQAACDEALLQAMKAEG